MKFVGVSPLLLLHLCCASTSVGPCNDLCSNGGTCHYSEDPDAGEPQCVCMEGFTGSQCQLAMTTMMPEFTNLYSTAHMEVTTTQLTTEASEQPVVCGADETRCTDGLRCVPTAQVCDGHAQCDDASDEVACQQCSEEKFVCDGGSSCLSLNTRCDGVTDCGDGTDEQACDKNIRFKIGYKVDEAFSDELASDTTDTYYSYREQVAVALTYHPYVAVEPLQRPVVYAVVFSAGSIVVEATVGFDNATTPSEIADDIETEIDDNFEYMPDTLTIEREGGEEHVLTTTSSPAVETTTEGSPFQGCATEDGEFACGQFVSGCISLLDRCNGAPSCPEAADELRCERSMRFRVSFTIDDPEFPVDLLDPATDMYLFYKFKVAKAVTFLPYIGMDGFDRPLLQQIVFSAGSTHVDSVVGYTGETTAADIHAEIVEPLSTVFDVVPDTLEVRAYDDEQTTFTAGTTLTYTSFTLEQTTSGLVTEVPAQCSRRGQLVTDIFTEVTVCDCELGFFGQSCQLDFDGDATLCPGVQFDLHCYNGGSCRLSEEHGKPRCECPFRVAGRQCEIICRDDQFACDLDCVPSWWRCDDEADCPSGRDEEGCDEDQSECEVAFDERIQCGDARANQDEYLCNDERDCCFISDNSREQGDASESQCFYPRGHECYDIQCENGGLCKSIGVEYYCDCSGQYMGDRCEMECDPEDYFICESHHDTNCILNEFRCDNEEDCVDGSDERDCDDSQYCNFYCVAADTCIRESWLCDSYNDCGDYSDEENCTASCSDGFLCDSGRCIHYAEHCDGDTQCPDGEDELDCEDSVICPDYLSCDNGTTCIEASWFCDGYYDCDDGYDENACDGCEACEAAYGSLGCIPNEPPVCVCMLGFDSQTLCETFSCDVEQQLVAIYSATPQQPACGIESAWSFPVTSLEECKQTMCLFDDFQLNVLSLRTEESICSLQFCDSWDLDMEPATLSNIIYVLLPAGYNPCVGVNCGDGECVLRDLPNPLNDNFPELNYQPICLCADGITTSAQAGCVTSNDECESGPCMYGGTCQEELPGTYTCHCIYDRVGHNCQYDLAGLPHIYFMHVTIEGTFLDNYHDPSTEEYHTLKDSLIEFIRTDIFVDIADENDKPVIMEMFFGEGSIVVEVVFGIAVPVTTSLIRDLVHAAFENTDTDYALEAHTDVTVFAIEGATPFYCGFETYPDDECLYENAAAQFNWTVYNTTTPSFDTGPHQAYDGELFLYTEASEPRVAGDNAKIRTPIVNVYGEGCLSFALSMYGADMGFLTIYQYTYNSAFGVFTRKTIYKEGGYTVREIEDTSSFWSERHIPVDLQWGQDVYFELEGTVWTGSRGDMALDDVTLHLNSDLCGDVCYYFDDVSEEDGTLECCAHDYALSTATTCAIQVFYLAECVLEGSGNPHTNFTAREYYSSLSLYGVFEIVSAIYMDTIAGDDTATRLCYGTFPEGAIRLMDFQDETTPLGYGRIEVMMNGDWTTLCDDGFNDQSAQVLCTHLGFSGGEVRTDAFYGRGNGEIFFSSVGCLGSEEKLYECTMRRNLGEVCTHAEDVGVVCSIENTRPVSYIGPNETQPERYRNEDDTLNSIFVPNIGEFIERNGKLTQWTASFITDVAEVYFQVWRTRGQNIFELAGQTRVSGIAKTIDLAAAVFNTYTVELQTTDRADDRIAVEAGDFIGLYFRVNNPVPWSSKVCYESEEQLRYVYQPEFSTGVPVVGEVKTFNVAPLAWDPCRTYMLNCKIENDPVEDTGDDDEDTVTPVVTPIGALFFESFEAGYGTMQFVNQSQTGNGTINMWMRHTGGTSSVGTGPESAIRGSYYLYAEASETHTGDQFIIQTPTVNLNTSVCVSFLYHMFGSGIGSLKVTMLDIGDSSSTAQVLFEATGSQSDSWLWHNAKIQFRFNSGSLRFVATMGNGFQGDMGIDNILIRPGACPVELLPASTPRSEAGSQNFTVLEQAPEVNISYVSSGANGSDSNVNCTKLAPCRTAGVAWNVPSKNKTIIFDSRYETTYALNLNDAPAQIQNLVLTVDVPPSSGGQKASQSLVTVELSGTTRCFDELNITNLKITGNVEFDCSLETSNSLILNYTTVAMTDYFNVNASNVLTASIRNSRVRNSLVSFTAHEQSMIEIKDSVFVAPLPNLPNTTVLTSNITRDKTATGLHLNFPRADSSHVVRITRSEFSGLYQHLGNNQPLGAITVVNTWEDSQVKVMIDSSTFALNERALDLSVKGDIDVLIDNSEFVYNFANGSGGAVRITSHLENGLGALATVKKGKLTVVNSTFSHNIAQTSSMYDAARDIYYQSRSPGSGGAIFVSIVVPSQLLKDGLVSIDDSTFSNNTAEVQGGTLYVNPEISTEIKFSTLSNTLLDWRPKFGDMVYATCNMTIQNTTMNVVTTDGTTPILSYQASDAANYRLLLDNLEFECPVGHWIEQLNTTSFSRVGGSGLGTLQIYCRGCQDDEYSLNISRATFMGQDAGIKNSVICTECPYGAQCQQGILNTDGFWGTQQRLLGTVEMYQCPEEYCEKDTDVKVYYDACAAHRMGTLCGRCADGYSESLFGTTCVPNEDCGMQNWWVALFLAVYGILYALFFMFEGDWENFISWVSKKMKRDKKKDATKDKDVKSVSAGQKSSTIEKKTHLTDPKKSVRTDDEKKEGESGDEETEEPDNADMGKSGYFQIFMYFIQTASLLKVKIVVVEDDIYKRVYRPQDILPSFLIDGIQEILSMNINFLEGKTCLFESLSVVSKTYLKLIFVGYLFMFVIALYLMTFGCCVFLPVKNRPTLGPLSNTARILITILSLFLYTYQSVAEDAFLLLNCVNVDGSNILFYDGTVSCLQDWQYAVIALVTIFVIPFFTILLFGPKLLEQKRIGIIFFMVSCLFPLFMSVPIICMYFNVFKKKTPQSESSQSDDNNHDSSRPLTRREAFRDQNLQHNHDNSDDETDEMNCCCGDVREIRDEIVDLLSGPYRTDIFQGICYEGVLNFRRMIMVVLFTFITDILLRQMALACACFIILLVHIRAKPFRQNYSNYVESIALALLLIISGTNMVKAAFYHSQTVPRGSNYLIIVIYEWIEAICLGVLPLVIIVAIILAMLIKTGSKALKRTNAHKDHRFPDRNMHYYDYRGRHYGGPNYRNGPHRNGLGSHDMVYVDDYRSPMPNMRWQPKSPNIYRQSAISTIDPNAFSHATRYPAFDDTSDDGSRSSRRRLPRAPAESPRKLRRTDSPLKLKRTNTHVISEDVLEGLPRADLIPRLGTTPWMADNTSSLLRPNAGLPRTDVDSLDRLGGQTHAKPSALPRTNAQSLDHSSSDYRRLPRTDASESSLPRIYTNDNKLPRTDLNSNNSNIATEHAQTNNRLPRS